VTRYTFAVCEACGVQSPPIIIYEDTAVAFVLTLNNMGWHVDKHDGWRCPKCQEKLVA